MMILIWCLITCIASFVSCKNLCHNCLGKIHTHEQLELTKQSVIINPKQICSNDKYKFIVIIKSGLDIQRRNFTRSTWAKELNEHFNVPILYALSVPPSNSSLQAQIDRENELFHDILQFNLIESYYNLTLKTTSVLLWYEKYCSQTSDYLFYVDDDILVHVDQFMLYMNTINQTTSIQGWFEKFGKIQRRGLGGVSKEDFPIDIVPDYLWGAAVLYPSTIITNILIKEIFHTKLPIFFRDDVFINGFIADQARIVRQQMPGLVLYDPSSDDLKQNMIVIDFKQEQHRIRAWNCYKYELTCNEKHVLVVIKICLGISLILTLISFGLTHIPRTFINEIRFIFYDLQHLLPWKINWNLFRRKLQRFNKFSALNTIIFFTLYLFIQNKFQ